MPVYLLLVEVILLTVLGPELGAITCNQFATNEIEVVGYFHRLTKNFLDSLGIIPPEIGDGIVIRMKIPQQPHHFNVAFALFFKPA